MADSTARAFPLPSLNEQMERGESCEHGTSIAIIGEIQRLGVARFPARARARATPLERHARGLFKSLSGVRARAGAGVWVRARVWRVRENLRSQSPRWAAVNNSPARRPASRRAENMELSLAEFHVPRVHARACGQTTRGDLPISANY